MSQGTRKGAARLPQTHRQEGGAACFVASRDAGVSKAQELDGRAIFHWAKVRQLEHQKKKKLMMVMMTTNDYSL